MLKNETHDEDNYQIPEDTEMPKKTKYCNLSKKCCCNSIIGIIFLFIILFTIGVQENSKKSIEQLKIEKKTQEKEFEDYKKKTQYVLDAYNKLCIRDCKIKESCSGDKCSGYKGDQTKTNNGLDCIRWE